MTPSRNRLINGGFRINQRGSIAATAGVQYGPDRWLAAVSGGTGISATFNASSFAGSRTGVGAFLSGSWTSGLPYFAQRIESFNSVDLNGRQITVSGKFYQDTGSSQAIVVRISKPTALNNFSSATVVATSANIAIPSGTTTAFSATFTLGATDATNGLMIEVYLAAAVTVASKNFGIADMQLEPGSAVTPFEFRQMGTELDLCRRYYQTLSNFLCGGYGMAGQVVYQDVSFPVPMRAVPVSSVTGSITYLNASGYSISGSWAESIRLQLTVTALGYGAGYGAPLIFNAEL